MRGYGWLPCERGRAQHLCPAGALLLNTQAEGRLVLSRHLEDGRCRDRRFARRYGSRSGAAAEDAEHQGRRGVVAHAASPRALSAMPATTLSSTPRLEPGGLKPSET